MQNCVDSKWHRDWNQSLDPIKENEKIPEDFCSLTAGILIARHREEGDVRVAIVLPVAVWIPVVA